MKQTDCELSRHFPLSRSSDFNGSRSSRFSMPLLFAWTIHDYLFESTNRLGSWRVITISFTVSLISSRSFD